MKTGWEIGTDLAPHWAWVAECASQMRVMLFSAMRRRIYLHDFCDYDVSRRSASVLKWLYFANRLYFRYLWCLGCSYFCCFCCLCCKHIVAALTILASSVECDEVTMIVLMYSSNYILKDLKERNNLLWSKDQEKITENRSRITKEKMIESATMPN